MDVSIILCTYNRCESLKTVLESISKLQVDQETSWELLVVDNNSTDDTEQVCKEFIDKYSEFFRYLFEERQGKTFALNTGIRASQGDIIAFTDDDVEIDNKWLSAIRQAFATNPECKAFGGRVIPVWPDTVPRWIVREGDYKNTWGAIVEHDFGEQVVSYHQDGVYPPCGANMFYGKEIFAQYGYFNESLNEGVKNIPMLEDIEFCKRLLDKHENMLYIPDALVYHPVVQERLTKKYFRKHAFKSGRAQYFINNMQRKGQYVMLNLRKNRRSLLNVPLYFVHTILGISKKYLSTIYGRKPQESQYYENMLVHYLGIMYECFVQRKNESTTT